MDEQTRSMMSISYKRLKLESFGYFLASGLFLLTFFILLRQNLGDQFALRWLIPAGGITAYIFYFLYVHLRENHLKTSPATLLPTLGLANWITLSRASLIAVLAGFLLCPWPEGWLSWVPGIVYLVSVCMDIADGFVARSTGRVTNLGEVLDMQWDSVGFLVASFLSVLYGQTPRLYVLVGLARYLFLFGQYLRERRGLPLFELPSSLIRRPFAAMQMGFLAVVLMPFYFPPVTQVAAWFFMAPFLANFLRDWLAVSGLGWVRATYQPVKASSKPRIIQFAFPLVIRVILTILLLMFLLNLVNQQPVNTTFLLITALSIPALLLGAAGRLISLLVLLMAGFNLLAAPWEWLFWMLGLFGAICMMVGTGRFSIWKPEDKLLFKYAGERRSSGKTL